MNTKLSHEDYAAVLACIEAIHRCRRLADFPGDTLRALGKLIPSNLAAYNEVNVARSRLIALTDRPLENAPELARAWEKYSAQHPLLRYISESGDGQAVKISDFLSAREYHRLDLYRAVYKPVGAEDQMALTLRSDSGLLVTFVFNRACRDFREIDRIKLNLLRPHLVQAYANAVELAEHLDEKRDLQSALRETGHGVIAIGSGCEVVHATPGAMDTVRRYCVFERRVAALPPAMIDWLTSGAERPFTVRSGTATLVVRRPRQGTRRLLLLSEENAIALPAGVRLTFRESQVLGWLAEGKANGEIGIILGIASGTVKLHVEHLLTKLGVENRTAAAILLRRASF